MLGKGYSGSYKSGVSHAGGDSDVCKETAWTVETKTG